MSATPQPEEPLVAAAPADRHRRIAGRFTQLVFDTESWDAPSPVAEWTALDVVVHLTTWFPAFLASGASIELPETDAAQDPAAAWASQSTAVQAILEDPDASHAPFQDPHIPDMSVADAIDRIYTADVFMHSWDLARATGQPDTLDAEFCASLLAGMEPMEEAIRSSGHYGQRFPTADDADAQTKLLAFIGRDPFWRG